MGLCLYVQTTFLWVFGENIFNLQNRLQTKFLFQIILICLLIKQHIVGIWCKLVFYRKYYDKLKQKDVIKFKIRWYIFWKPKMFIFWNTQWVGFTYTYGKQCLKDLKKISYVVCWFFFLMLFLLLFTHISMRLNLKAVSVERTFWLLPRNLCSCWKQHQY